MSECGYQESPHIKHPGAMSQFLSCQAKKRSIQAFIAIDLSILPPQAKELDANTEYYVELLARGTGKSKDEIRTDIQRPKYFRGQDAIDYGLCDQIIQSRGVQMDKKVWLRP